MVILEQMVNCRGVICPVNRKFAQDGLANGQAGEGETDLPMHKRPCTKVLAAVRTFELPALEHFLDLIEGQVVSARMVPDLSAE